MPIRLVPENPEAAEELRRGLGAFSDRARGARELSDRAVFPKLNRLHPVFTVALEDIAEGRLLDAVCQVGWRGFATEGEGAGRTAEISWDDDDPIHAFGGVTEGGFVEQTLAALEDRRGREAADRAECTWQILRIPGLHVFAVWLHTDSEDTDLLVPLGPTAPPLEAGRAYSAEEFGRALIDPARTILTFDASQRL